MFTLLSVSDASDNLMFPDSKRGWEHPGLIPVLVCFFKSSCNIKFDDVFDYFSVLLPALVCIFHLIYSTGHEINGPPTGALSFWSFIPISCEAFLATFAF